MAHGNFEPTLTLDPGGMSLMACGPLHWNEPIPGGRRSQIWAQIEQGATLGSSARSRDFQPSDSEWEVPVRVIKGGPFVSGQPATARAAAVIAMDHGEQIVDIWQDTVQLV